MTEQTDALLKPDMSAVLSRTHLQTNTHGFLLPVLEAISNAIHGIEEQFGDRGSTSGSISVRFNNWNSPLRFSASVADNGAGLNDANYQSFKTPFSGHKLKTRGRGFGRFIAFKVFAKVVYESRYTFFDSSNVRSFRFDISSEQEFQFTSSVPSFSDQGLQVTYDQPLTNWHELISQLQKEEIANEIGAHFLPYFLYRWLPQVTIQFDDEQPIDIRSRFEKMFVQFDEGDLLVEIEGKEETLHYSLARIARSQQFKSHCLLLAAADRIVGQPRDLSTKLGQSTFVDDHDERYVIIAVVRGDAFESRLNDARTNISLTPRVVEDIVSKVSDVIQIEERGQIEKIKQGQSVELIEALRENPILRLGLRGKSIDDYVQAKPNHWSSEQFVSDLAIERYRASHDLTKQIVAAASSAENYEASLKYLVTQIDQNKKEALAEYVIHRKNIIELVESARKFQENGGHAPEDAIHDLIFKRFSDSVSKQYFEHNLWLIDDALAFLPYVSSDRTLHGGKRAKGDKVTDLLFFDESIVLGDQDGTTLTIVEFKKPSRNNYSFGPAQHDPIQQVLDTLRKATAAGGVAKTDGAHISFTGVVRKFAFVIADLTSTFVNVLEQHDFKNDQNPKIYFRYRERERALVQAFGYETLIENAKKRNQAFFSVLFDE